MTEQQLAELLKLFDSFGRSARALGITDQQLSEWLLKLGARWLLAHGVSSDSIMQWVSLALRRPVILPMTREARSRNDFGGMR